MGGSSTLTAQGSVIAPRNLGEPLDQPQRKRRPANREPVEADDNAIPDVSADGVSVRGGPYGLALTFHLSTEESAASNTGDAGPAVARVRMNAELAEDLAGILGTVLTAHKKSMAERALQKKKGNGK